MSHSARVAPKPKTSRNRPPSQTPEEMASKAVDELAVEFFKAVAPTSIRVKLKADMLIVATGYFDGRYETVKKLPRSATDFLVAVRDLPEVCERNQFRVAVAELDGRENLFAQEFIWSGSSDAEGFSVKVPMETLAKTSAEKFVAKLYSVGNPQPILEREFSLAAPK
jgi:hypothetical protein